MIGWATDVVRVKDKEYRLMLTSSGNSTYHRFGIGEAALRALAAKLAALGLAPPAGCEHLHIPYWLTCPICGEKLR